VSAPVSRSPAPSKPAGVRPRRGRPRGPFSQHRRFDTLLALLQRYPRGLTLYQLATELQVTPRSLRRYLAEVSREVDLVSSPERPGGPLLWRLAASELPRKIEVRRTQAYAMLATRALFDPMRGSTLYEEIDLFADRLLGVARRPGRGPNAGVSDERLEERFVYVPFAPKDYGDLLQELDDVFQAVADLRPLRCLTFAADGSEERVVLHPYAMLLYKDAIFVVAKRVDTGKVEAMPLERIRDTTCLVDERFALPRGFAVKDFVQGQFGLWRARDKKRVVVDLDARVAEFARSRRAHPSQRFEELPGGGVRLTLELGDLSEIAGWVLGFGDAARVIEPPDLVERVKTELKAALARYER
jgi:predicted DNA-binding transcriptional regulator YafY